MVASGHVTSVSARLSDLLERQRAAFHRDGAPSLTARLEDVTRIRSLVLAEKDRLVAAVQRDFGARSREEFLITDVATVVQACDHIKAHLRKWMRPHRVKTSLRLQPGRAEVHPQPLGVVGVVSPWNYPVNLALIPLVGALAAGNRVMIKPSEHTPHTSELLENLLGAAFGEERVAVVQGDASVGSAFAGLAFDHLFFTGSTEVGRKVMAAAAQNLVPVTLELGGKSPVLVAEDRFRNGRLERTAAAIAYGKLLNAGQTCIAPDYALIPRRRQDAFVQAFRQAVLSMFPTLLDNPDYTGIVHERHCERLQDLVDEARSAGARVEQVLGPSEEFRGQTRKFAPTLILDPPATLRVSTEEIFGPILVVRPVDGIDAAIRHVNQGPRPLALYVFSDDDRVVERVVNQTHSGGVTVNDTLVHFAEEHLPFGGVGASGMGAYHGEASFRAFSHMKPVFVRTRLDPTRLLRPPYSKLKHSILGWLLRD